MSDEAILEDYEDYEDYETEDFESDGEDFGEDYGEDLGERVLRFRRRAQRPRTARPRSYVKARPTSQFVTQTQLSSALGKVANDIKKNGSAIQSVSRRVSVTEDVNRKQSVDLSKQAKINDKQAKDIAAVKKDVANQAQSSMLTLLLSQPKTLPPTSASTTIGGTAVPAQTKFAIGGDNNLLLLLALTGAFGGGSGGGMSDMMPILLLTMMK